MGGTDAGNLEPRLVTGTNAVRSALFVPALIVFLDSLGVTFSAVWGLLGFGGVAVSLGLKDVVSDFIAGVILMVNPTFKVGDTIRAGSVQGTVIGIGATRRPRCSPAPASARRRTRFPTASSPGEARGW